MTIAVDSASEERKMDDLGIALVVEDDDDVRHLVVDVLRQAGFEVLSASTGREGAEIARREDPSVVTLDLGLPDIDGFEVLRRIRTTSDAYVVMLTARDEEPDTLLALQSGADDYLTKPFRPRELRARIAAMMRRPRGGDAAPQDGVSREAAPEGSEPREAVPRDAAPQGSAQRQAAPRDAAPRDAGGPGGWAHRAPRTTASPAPGHGGSLGGAAAHSPRHDALMRHSGLALDPRTRMAWLASEPLDLTRSEFDLLHALLRAGGAVITRAELVRVARGERFREDSYVSEADERAVEVHLGNLRRKLGDDPRSPRWLVTVRGVGYRLAPVA
jgi:DNA-binding response OmpR family regulator